MPPPSAAHLTLAQATNPAPAVTSVEGGTPPPGTARPAPTTTGTIVSFLPYVAIAVLFYFVFLGPKRREDKKKRDMLAQLKRGDRVQTIGGVLGSVVDVQEGRVQLKVDETSNAKVWFTRGAIDRVVVEETK